MKINYSEEYFKNVQRIMKSTSNVAPLIRAVNKQIEFEGIQKAWNSNITLINQALSPLGNLAGKFEGFHDKIKKSIMILANQGWYIDMSEPPRFLFKLADEIEAGNSGNIDNYLVDYYSKKKDNILKKIVAVTPKRETILKAIFSAHDSQIYELSVPVGLIQVDGICKELADGYFFMRDYKTKSPQTMKHVRSIEDEYIHMTIKAAFLTPLKSIQTINMSFNERVKFEKENGEVFEGLNRHLILHGDSHDYNTQVNSLKVMSLINYIADVLNDNNSHENNI